MRWIWLARKKLYILVGPCAVKMVLIMTTYFIKKYWPEDNTLFYLQFQGGKAIKQIVVSTTGRVYLTEDAPVAGNLVLYNKEMEKLDPIK